MRLSLHTSNLRKDISERIKTAERFHNSAYARLRKIESKIHTEEMWQDPNAKWFTSKELLDKRASLPAILDELAEITEQTLALRKRARMLRRKADQLIHAGSVIDDVVVSEKLLDHAYEICLVQDGRRSARAYLNAHNKIDWGINFDRDSTDGPPHGPRREQWQGLGYRFIDAVKICQAWVLHKNEPTEIQKKHFQMLGNVDPGGHVGDDDCELLHAIEAAWETGTEESRDLARKLVAATIKSQK